MMMNPHFWFNDNPQINRVYCGKYFVIFTPIPWEMIQFDEHIFQMGGSTNRQLDNPWNEGPTVDGFYIPNNHRLDGAETL